MPLFTLSLLRFAFDFRFRHATLRLFFLCFTLFSMPDVIA